MRAIHMRTPFLLAAILVSLPVTNATAALHDRCTFVWVDVANVVPSAYTSATEEAASILARAGLNCVFRRGDSDSGIVANEFFVILLPHAHGGRTPGRLVMGSVKARNGHPDDENVVRVYVEPIVEVLSLRSAGQDRARVARAIGRVIAHEVIHIAAPLLGHSKRGLMAAVLTAKELVGPRVQIDPNFRAALRAPEELGETAEVADTRTNGNRRTTY